DVNGQKLPGYLSNLGEFFILENAELLNEVDQLSRNIEHIKEVVAMQQSYAKVSGVFENLQAHRLVEDAIAMNIGAFERHGVEVAARSMGGSITVASAGIGQGASFTLELPIASTASVT